MLQFSQLFQWNLAAEFIADHLNYELLEPAHELVRCRFFFQLRSIELFVFSFLAQNSLVPNESSRRSTRKLFRLRESSLFVVNRRRLRRLCRQRLCDT